MRSRALLAYLILHPGAPQDRAHLAALFWPDSSDAQARTNLRRELHHLRHTLPAADRCLEIAPSHVLWRDEAPAMIDVVAFQRACDTAAAAERAGDRAACRQALHDAVTPIEGELLPGVLDEPILTERDRLRRAMQTAVQKLLDDLEELGDWPAAASLAERLVRDDSLDEAAHRRLILLRERRGDITGSLRAWQQCAAVLKRELQIEPSAELRAIHARLRQLEPAPPLPESSGGRVTTRLPLIGRAAEWMRLHQAWRCAAPGRPHFLLIFGEGGIGKTRLAEELLDWAVMQKIATARTRSYAAEGAMSFMPIAEWLRMPALRSDWMMLSRTWRTDLALVLPELQSPGRRAAARNRAHESWERPRLFEAMARAINGTEGRPRVLLFDDLQWCDRETFEWLHFFARFAVSSNVLVVGTVRDVEAGVDHPLWALCRHLRAQEQVTEIKLGPLDATATAELARHVAPPSAATTDAPRLFRETEGFPLFVVEMVRGASATGDGPADAQADAKPVAPGSATALALPPKVRAVIEGRLVNLSEAARDVVGIAAAAGRAFSLAVLRASSGNEEARIVSALDELCRRGIVRAQAEADRYDFTHDKIRDVAYAQLGPARRKWLHQHLAEALAGPTSGGDPDAHAAEIAAHFEQAGEIDRAVEHYERAARKALLLFANTRAIDLYERALALLRTVRPGVARDRREYAALTAVGVALVAVHGYGAPAVAACYERAAELGRQLEGAPSAPVVRALAIARVAHVRLPEAEKLGETLRVMSREQRNRALRVEANYVLGVTAFWQGRFAASRTALQRALADYDARIARQHLTLFAQDAGVICRARLACTLWYLGSTVAAVRESGRAVAHARRIGHPFSLAYALTYAAWVMNETGDRARTTQLADELVRHAGEHAIGFLGQFGECMQGWLGALSGEPAAGIDRIRTALDVFRDTGLELLRPYGYQLLARACALAGEHEAGLVALDEVLALTERSGQLFNAAEFLRLKGELLRAQGADEALVRPLFRRALAVARRQGARALEERVRRVAKISRANAPANA